MIKIVSSWHVPGVKASQSAQRSLPGIVRISSARAFSLRNCWRLLMPFGILKENECEEWKQGMDRKIKKERNRG